RVHIRRLRRRQRARRRSAARHRADHAPECPPFPPAGGTAMSMMNNPVNSARIGTEEESTSAPSVLDVGKRSETARKRLTHRFNGGILMGIVVVISLLWSVPTFGLFVASFRTGAATQSSGWWEGLVPPWHFTLDNYQQVLQSQGLGQAFLNSLIIA